MDDTNHISAFSVSKYSQRQTTDKFLRKGEGFGGLAETAKVAKVWNCDKIYQRM
jgi:hypothetical protein